LALQIKDIIQIVGTSEQSAKENIWK
jgi:hypothetical protein